MVCLVYLNDSIVHSEDLPTLLDRLRLLFDRLLAIGLKLKVSKCKLLHAKVCYLGYKISIEWLTTDPAKVEAVWDWPTLAARRMCNLL